MAASLAEAGRVLFNPVEEQRHLLISAGARLEPFRLERDKFPPVPRTTAANLFTRLPQAATQACV